MRNGKPSKHCAPVAVPLPVGQKKSCAFRFRLLKSIHSLDLKCDPATMALSAIRQFTLRWPWPKKPSVSALTTDAPQSVRNAFPAPHSVGQPTQQCGETHSQRAERVLDALERA